MSIDTRLNPNVPNLDALGALERQGLEGRQVGGGVETPAATDVAFGEQALRAPTVDDGELVLNAPAWEGEGERVLVAGDFRLNGEDRGQDLDAGVDATAAPLV